MGFDDNNNNKNNKDGDDENSSSRTRAPSLSLVHSPIVYLIITMDKTFFSSNEGKPITCKAAICRKAGEALVIEDIHVDPPQAYEVRIKILCTSLCHTDLTFWKLSFGPISRFPRILGHEAVGVVESIGENVDGFKQGDVVLPVFHPYCEECKDCKSSKTNWCDRYAEDFISNTRRYGMASRFKDSSGEVIHHFLFVSSFSEYTVVDIAHLVKISPEIPVDKAALLSCGVSTGIGAAWKVANVEEGSTIAIFGLGAVGLAVAEGARLRGAAKIIGIDTNSDKFELGKVVLYIFLSFNFLERFFLFFGVGLF
jgi:S-(hydroxymethyl)glutathione dehydrogenase/alcohol dehydrogenase